MSKKLNNSITNDFYNSFKPVQEKPGRNIFINCVDDFFKDLFSTDSATHAKAQRSISNVYFGEKDVTAISDAINRLQASDKDYFDSKSRLIAELGYIKDSTNPQVATILRKLYEQTADTSIFQNEVMTALARHKTTASVTAFKELILQDPPVFDNSYNYTTLFRFLEDSLELAKQLYPDLLQLSTLEDYKEPVISLLVTLVDSGFVKADVYESYFSKIYFDAKIALKKQQGKDEKKMEKENKKEDDDDPVRTYNYSNNYGDLYDYAVLLMPFYDKNTNVQKFFNRLLASKDESLQLNTAIVLLRNQKPVPDSLLLSLAAKDLLRSRLYARLEKIKRLDKFPAAYKSQLAIAKSYLVEDKDYNKMDSIVYLFKQATAYRDKKGVVYFFKYRVKKEDDWKIGLSGLQPTNPKEISSDDKLSVMTDKKLKADTSQNEQLQEQLKRILFTFRKSAKKFFTSDNYGYRYNKVGEYE